MGGEEGREGRANMVGSGKQPLTACIVKSAEYKEDSIPIEPLMDPWAAKRLSPQVMWPTRGTHIHFMHVGHGWMAPRTTWLDYSRACTPRMHSTPCCHGEHQLGNIHAWRRRRQACNRICHPTLPQGKDRAFIPPFCTRSTIPIHSL